MSMEISGAAGASAMHAMSGASTGQPPQVKMSNLFDSIDTSGSGSITQSQFDHAFQTKNPPAVFQNQGADAIFSALDPNGTGSVSKSDFVSGMSKLMASLRADSSDSSSSSSSGSDTLQSSLQSLNQIDPNSVSTDSPPGSLFSFTV